MERMTVKLPAVGQRLASSISSSYSDQYDPVLTNVIPKKEFERMVEDLNDTILENWPCLACYLSSCLCIPCTLGLSILATSYCTSLAEAAARKYLRNVSLAARFYDRQVTFRLLKGLCNSHVEIEFPISLVSPDLESAPESTQDEVAPLLSSGSSGPFGKRMKDN
jgi:hypothetical protein